MASRAGESSSLPGLPLSPGSWGRLGVAAALGLGCRRPAVAWPTLALVAAALFCSGAATTARLDSRPAATAPTPWEPSLRCEDEVAAVLRLRGRPRIASSGRWSAPATVLAGVSRRDSALVPVPAPAEVYLTGEGEPPGTGSLLRALVTLRPPTRAAIPGGFDTAAWLAGRGIGSRASIRRGESVDVLPGGLLATVGAARDRLQDRLRALLARGLPPREAAIAGGVLLGGGTDAALRDPFARLGLAHLFALSGLHVGILAGLALVAIGPFGAGPGPRLAVLAPALAAYVLLVDLPASVLRAAGLVTLALLGPVAGRRLDGLRLLGLLLWCQVAWQPGALLDTGTRLSYLAAGGIVGGQRLLRPRLAGLAPRLRWVLAALGVTVSAQVATLPEVAHSFGYLPLAGPLANLLLVPVFGLVVTLLATGLVTSLLWPWAGEGVLALAWLLLRPLEALTATAAGLGGEVGLPGWGPWRAALGGGLVLLLIVALRRRRRAAIVAAAVSYAALLLVAGWQTDGSDGVDVWQFAVGQGDCALMRLPDGWTCLVDTGGAWSAGSGPLARDVLPFLRRRGLRALDAAVLTHGHDDHVGGRDALAAAVSVGQWFTGGSAAPGSGRSRRPVLGDTLHVAGDWSLVCLHPPRGTLYPQENDCSLVLGLCRRGELRGLWTGDLERGGEGKLLAHLPTVPASGADVLKAGHHGSATSSSPRLLERLRPRLVVISCGVANRHRHPSHGPFVAAAETLALRRTDLHGTIHLHWGSAGGLRHRAMRPRAP